ncbi:MAG: hypothetical protein KKG97_01610 [Proteobacteria bacterium]|nr:hypothetical protein [Pseudomonadota bacterium]
MPIKKSLNLGLTQVERLLSLLEMQGEEHEAIVHYLRMRFNAADSAKSAIAQGMLS